MKKLLAIVAGLWAGAAIAGDYHVEHTLRCSECHTMHASRSHGLNQETFEATFRDIGINAVANRNLLLWSSTNETCLACHDGQASFPDVLGTNGGMVAADTRSAGALNSSGLNGLPATEGTYPMYAGHTLGVDTTPPGYVGTYEATPLEGFNCANCHAVHGSLAFRNLGLSRYMGLPSGAAQTGSATNAFIAAGPAYNMLDEFNTNDPTTVGREAVAAGDDVFVEAAGRTYETAQVQFRAGTGGMNKYCAVCHGNFHGDGNTRDLIGGVDFIRHPTSGVVRDVTGGATPLLNFAAAGQIAQFDLVRPAWVTAEGITGQNFEAACLSCHKGHGNTSGYGLIYPSNTGTVSNFEDGDAAPSVTGGTANDTLRNLCVTCHAQGRDLSDPSVK